jgi:hypothetical protein
MLAVNGIVYKKLSWKSRSEVEEYAQRFSEDLHDYLYKYDNNYRLDLEQTVQQWVNQ